MAVTSTTTLPNSVKALFARDYLMATTGNEYFDQVSWAKMAMNGQRGSSVQFPIYESLDPATGTLTETADITPVAMADSLVTININEYGNGVQLTALLKATAYTEVGQAASTLVGINRARSVDIIVRTVAVGGTNIMRVNGRAASSSLTAGVDNLTYGFMMQATGRARAWNIPRADDGHYFSIVHPLVTAELSAIPLWQNVSAYQNDMDIFEGEVGMLAGIRFIESYNGKLKFSGGTVAQAATTTTGTTSANSVALSPGGTAVTVASATGIAVGDYITVGALESSVAEQVQVTAVAGSTLTIQGIGNTQSNFGFRYAHANGVAVTEADQVASIPLLGPKSIAKAWSDLTGERGELRITGPFDNLGRFVVFGWYQIAGWARTSEHWTLLLEAACSNKHPGAEQY